MSTTCLHSYISIYSQLTLDVHVANKEQRLVTMSVSLCTQTVLPNLTSQILNTRVWFLDLWNTSFTSVHYILEHGLAIITESFVHSIWITQLPWSKSELEVMWQSMLFLILFICNVYGTGPNWFELATANQSRC